MKGLFIHDTEADGLLNEVTKYHCTLLKQYKVNNWNLFLDPQHPEYQSAVDFANSKGVNLTIRPYTELESFLKSCRALACHNSFGYDHPLWKKLSGIEYDMFKDPGCRGTIGDVQVDLYDTLSMSRVLSPDRQLPPGCPDSVPNPVTGKSQKVGPHGLLAWGYRVANKKVQIDDWRNQPLWEYVNRVWEDVLINEAVWTELIREATGKKYEDDIKFMYKEGEEPKGMKMINWKNALRRRMLTDYLMVEQEFQGVCFNEKDARELIIRIDKMMKEIEEDVEPQLPLKEMSKSQQPNFPAKPFDGSGEISHHGWNWLQYKLGYPVNREALEYKAPPKTAFKGDGSVSTAGENYCKKNGVEDPSLFADFIRQQLERESLLKPLPDDMLELAKQDLRDEKMPNLMVEMKISNQDDIKKYLIRDANWKPTLWRVKDATRDQFKKTRSDSEVDILVRKYIDELGESEYKSLIINYLNMTDEKFKISVRKFDSRNFNDKTSEEIFKKFRRKARQLPTSPQLKDNFGKLCPNLERIDGHLAKQIVKWLSLRNRRSVLDPIDENKNDTGLLNHPRLKIDGKLPARFSGITNTGRCKHTVCANMPKPDPKVLLGKEMRALWGVPDGHYLMGCDGSNLEQLIAAAGAYEFDNGLYYDIVSNGDSHENNARAYTEVAGREVKRGESKGITYACLPTDTTKVLTRNGWKSYHDLSVGQEVMTYDDEKEVMVWDTIQHIHFFKDTPVKKMENRRFIFEATGDHRWYGKENTFVKGKAVTRKKVFTTDTFKTHYAIRTNAPYYSDKDEISEDMAAFWGWVITDGYMAVNHPDGRSDEVKIIQSPKKHTEVIESLLSRLGITYGLSWVGYKRDCKCYRVKKSDVHLLLDRSNLPRKGKHDIDWSLFVLSLSDSARRAFLEACYLAEGSLKYQRTSRVIAQNRGKIFEAIYLALVLDGKSPTVHHKADKSSCWNICYNYKTKWVWGGRTKVENSRKTDVFCLTTNKGTFVAKQGDYTTITGNCLYGAQSAKIAAMLDIPLDRAQAVIDALWDNNPGLKGRREALEMFWEATGKQYIYGMDGRKIWTRSKHSLLNAYQQNGGASLFDLVGVLFHWEIKKKGWYDEGVRRIIYYHK